MVAFGASPAFGKKKMTPEMQKVVPISETNDCEFIRTATFGVSYPSQIPYYAALATVNARGDSYKILTSNTEQPGKQYGLIATVTTMNIAVYKCNLPPKLTSPIPPEASGNEESEVLSYIDELNALAKLRDDGILTEEEFKQQKAKVLARENAPPKIKQVNSDVTQLPQVPLQRDKTSESILEELQSSSQQERTSASKRIYNNWIGDEQVYEEVAIVIRNQLPTLNKKSPKAQQEEVAWHIKALSCSGNQEYLPLLDELSRSPAKKIAKYAKKYKKILAEDVPCK